MQLKSNLSSITKGINLKDFLFFMVWPIASIYQIVNNFRLPKSMNIAWIVCGFLGLSYVLAPNSQADTMRIAMKLTEMHNTDFTLTNLFSSFYASNQDGNIDIILPLIIFITSQVTENYQILFAILALIFGYFYTRNIWNLIESITLIKISNFSGMLLITFVVILGPWDISVFRFNTAILVFMYGVTNYLFKGNVRSLWLLLFAILIHWSFILPVCLFIIYLIFRNRTSLYFVLFVISFILSIVNLDIIRQLFDNYAPSIIKQSRSGYLNEEYNFEIIESYTNARWYVVGHIELLKWFIFSSFSYMYLLKLNKIKKNKLAFKLFNITLLLFIFVNTFSIIDTIRRYYALANMLGISTIFYYYTNNYSILPPFIVKIGLLTLVIFVVVRLRMGFEYMGLLTLFGNPILALLVRDTTPLIELIKNLL